MHKLRKHWDKMHGNFRFPIEKYRDDVQHNTSSANGTNQTKEVSADEYIAC